MDFLNKFSNEKEAEFSGQRVFSVHNGLVGLMALVAFCVSSAKSPVNLDKDGHFRAGAGYAFDDLGKVRLGLSPTQQTSETLGFNHLYSHQVRFQLAAIL